MAIKLWNGAMPWHKAVFYGGADEEADGGANSSADGGAEDQ